MNGPDNALWAGFVGLFFYCIVGMAVTGYLLHVKIQESNKNEEEEQKWTRAFIMYELGLRNVMDLKNELADVVGYMPWIWAFGMKYFIPQILLVLFINLTQSSNEDGNPLFGNCGRYVSWPFQGLGVLCVVFAGIFVLVSIASPDVYLGFDIPSRNEVAAAMTKETNDDEIDNETGKVHKKVAFLLETL